MLQLWDFEGYWRLSRQIKNDLGPDMTLEGTAVFERDGDGLRLHESGSLFLSDGSSLFSTHSYLWRQDGDHIATHFHDGRDFFRFVPEGRVAAAHWCSPDQYDVVLEFDDWPNWRTTWTVTGPRKGYVMVSDYSPLAERPPY